MRYKKSLSLLFLVLVVGGSLFFVNSKKEPRPTYREVRPVVQSVQLAIATTGLVEPKNRLEMLPPIAGRLEAIYVEEGATVRKGQILALMSSTDRAALLDTARTQSAEKLKYWEEVYKPTPLMAPINGKVIVRSTEPGQSVNANTPILVLADKLIVKAQVDETDIGQVKIGQAVNITLDAYPEIKIAGQVEQISYESKIVNNVTIYEVDIIPQRTPAFFRSGMSTNVSIIKARKDGVLLIPENAVQHQQERAFVLLKEAAKPAGRQQAVQLGLSQDGQVEVLSGLTKENVILIQENLGLRNGKKMKSFIARPGGQPKKARS